MAMDEVSGMFRFISPASRTWRPPAWRARSAAAGRDAVGFGAPEADGVVVQRGLEVLFQPSDKLVNQCRELVFGGFDELGWSAAGLEVVGELIVRDGSVSRIGQLFLEGKGAMRQDDTLADVVLLVEQGGERIECFGTVRGIALEDLEADLQFGLGFAEASRQFTQHAGAVHPSGGDVFVGVFQRLLDLQDSIDAA